MAIFNSYVSLPEGVHIVSFKVPPNPPGRCGFGQTAQIFFDGTGTNWNQATPPREAHWLTVKGNKKQESP